ncbi:MAG: hypothetical protein WBG86_14385 [Polyangiales bacterium]
MNRFSNATRWALLIALASITLAACGDDMIDPNDPNDPSDPSDPMDPIDPAPAFQTVEVSLQSWDFTWDGTVEPVTTDVELQIGWVFAYPVRPEGEAPAILESSTGIFQKGDIPGGFGEQNSIVAINRELATYDEYCGDPKPQLLLTLLEVDEGFDRTGTETRAALGGVAVAAGLAFTTFPVTVAVFGAGLVLEGLLAKNDDVGQGNFTLEDGSNRFMLSGRDTRSIVTVSKEVVAGSCDN